MGNKTKSLGLVGLGMVAGIAVSMQFSALAQKAATPLPLEELRNLSEEGALVESDKLPIEGTTVHFIRKDLNKAGRVVWVSGKFAGIAFSERLDPAEVLRHIPAPRPKIQPRYWRPGITTTQLNAEQRRLAESWMWSPSSSSRPGE